MAEPSSWEGVREVISRISYKPGWDVYFDDVWLMGREMPTLCIDATLPSSRPTGPKVLVGVGNRIPIPASALLGGEPALVGWVRAQLRAIEMHEVDEWLALDGEIVHSPHNEPWPQKVKRITLRDQTIDMMQHLRIVPRPNPAYYRVDP